MNRILPFLALAIAAQSQPAEPPHAYSVTEINAMMGPSMTMQIDRDGPRAMVETTVASQPGAASSPASHTRTFYDFENHKNYTWSLSDASAACSHGDFSGDWGDPFETSAALIKELASQHPHQTGTETVNGFTAKAMQTGDGPDPVKFWLDPASGLVVKAQSGSQTLLEIKRLSLAKPPAARFALPAKCGGGPATPAERISAETGGATGDFVDALKTPASAESCPVVFRVVQAGPMTPITGGFQLAIDRTAGDNTASRYTFASTSDGHMTFSGGGLREVTSQLQDGALHLPGPPARFYLEIAFGKAGSAGALIQRQCFGSPSTLLLVVKNSRNLTDGADWLWVKSRSN